MASENPNGPDSTLPEAAPAAPAVTGASTADGRLDAVLDVDLPLVVRFGATVLPLRTLSSLGAGSMVDLNRAPDDPVDLLVGERVIARGEVMVVDGQYGVRITELLSQQRPASAAVEA
jgi:flagellar motor switch protein FliN/FliY